MIHRSGSALSLLFAILVLVASNPRLVDAQSSNLPDGPALGASVDRFIYEDQGIMAVSFRYSALRARTVGSEIGVSLFPDALSAGSLYLAPDLGAAYNVSAPGFTLLAKAGLSVLTGLGGGFAFTPGYHFGAGLIVQAGQRFGIRVDAIRHVYVSANESEGIWSLGIGFTGLGRRLTLIP
jgi:hypothetical protein